MKKILLIVALAPVSILAQDDSTVTQKKFIKVISVSAYGGGEFYRQGFEDRTVFQQATPNSTLAFADLAGYQTGYPFYIQYGSFNTLNGFNLNLRLRGMPKFSELKIGISHSVTNYASQVYTQESSTNIGTTTLPGGEVIFTDSVSFASHSYSWNADILQLNLAWIVRTNPRAWLSVYTGFGVMTGIGYNGILEYRHIHTSEYQHSSGVGPTQYSSNRQIISESSERYSAPMFGSYVAYIPMGINLRLGKRNNFLKHVVLFGEYNGSVQILAPKGINSKVRTASSMNGGVRWFIQAPGGNGHRDRQRTGREPHG